MSAAGTPLLLLPSAGPNGMGDVGAELGVLDDAGLSAA